MRSTRGGSRGRNLVHRGQNGGKSRFDLGPHAGVRKNVELVFPDSGEYARGDGSGIEPRLQLPRDLGHHRRRRTGGIERLRLAVARGAIAPAFADAGADKARAQDAYADAMRLELKAKPLRHADDGEFAG